MSSREEREHPLVKAARFAVGAASQAEHRVQVAQVEYEAANRRAASALAAMSAAGLREPWGDHWISNLRVLQGEADVLAEHRERLRQEYIAADQVRKAAEIPPVCPPSQAFIGKGLKCPNCGRLYLNGNPPRDDQDRPVCLECEAEPGHPTSVAAPVTQLGWNAAQGMMFRITRPRFLLQVVEG